MISIIEQDKIEELKELGGDEFVQEIVTLFLDQSDEIYKDIKNAVESKNADVLYKSSHKLKGSCLNIGAARLADISKTLELKGKTQDLSNLEEFFSQFNTIYQETYQEVSKLK
ncbi:MAG: Hpt domain-containing protein [Candidatus Sericytochromatia bacterium]